MCPSFCSPLKKLSASASHQPWPISCSPMSLHAERVCQALCQPRPSACQPATSGQGCTPNKVCCCSYCTISWSLSRSIVKTSKRWPKCMCMQTLRVPTAKRLQRLNCSQSSMHCINAPCPRLVEPVTIVQSAMQTADASPSNADKAPAGSCCICIAG